MSIFTFEERERVKVKLLEVGIELIREKGIKQMTISEVTKRTGIGKGTFYHFYEAKELYIYDVIQYSKEGLKRTFNEQVETNGGIDRAALDEILRQYSFFGKNNIISYITAEDEVWLRERLPEDCCINVPKEEEIIALVLGNIKGVSNDLNPHVLANMMKILGIVAEQRALLHQDVLEENVKLLVEQLLDYLFGTKHTNE